MPPKRIIRSEKEAIAYLFDEVEKLCCDLGLLQKNSNYTNFLRKDKNLSDLRDYIQSRNNLDVYSREEVNALLGSGGGGSSTNPDSITSDIDLGGWLTGETLPSGSYWWEAIIKLVTKIFYPTFVAPSGTLSHGINTLQIINDVITFTLTSNLNRGSIQGNLVSGVWNPNVSQNPRSGLATSYVIDGTSQSINTKVKSNYIVLQGNNIFTSSINYAIGPQPKDSKNQNYLTPLAAGSLGGVNTLFEGVYPIFAKTFNIISETQQSLVSMLSGNNIEYILAAESGGNKQSFSIPDAWLTSRPLIQVLYYNPVSQSFDPTNKISDFNQSSTTKSVIGNTINYTTFVNSTSDRGATRIKLIF